MSDLYARDGAAIAGLQKLRFFPQAVVGGRGVYLRDAAGREMMDFSGAWGAASLGYGHPALVRAVSAAVADPAGASVLSATNLPAVALAEALLALFPSDQPQKVWLGHSGSDANETAIRAVRQATGRQGIISFHGAYHGCTLGAMAISGHGALQGPKAEGLIQLPYPSSAAEAEIALAQLRAGIASQGAETIAACIFEPILSDGGLILPPAGFLAQLDQICRAQGILTICDEVKVGLGRSGRLHAFAHEGFRPDILVLGKGLGGGLPLSAVIGPAQVMDCATSFAMQTLHGNPISAAAGLAVLQMIAEEALVENAAKIGAHLIAGFQNIAASLSPPFDLSVRGRGLAIGLELRRDGLPAKAETAALVYHLHDLGLVAYYVGAGSNVIELTPPLTLTRAEADAGLALFAQGFDDLTSGRLHPDAAADFAGW